MISFKSFIYKLFCFVTVFAAALFAFVLCNFCAALLFY